MELVRRPAKFVSSFALFFLAINVLRAQAFFPLRDVRPGLHGVGRTVFSGDRIEQFQVDILGVLANAGPKQSIILARLSGGPLAETGIMQGMSGSPVYIDGKLLGAVALGFPFSKEPIAGIQPIESMLEDSTFSPTISARPASAASWTWYRTAHELLQFPSSLHPQILTPFGSMDQLITPLAMSGFTSATLQTLARPLRTLGFQLTEGNSAQSPDADDPARNSDPATAVNLASASAAVVPGSMISVGLLTGDMNMTADGTVTYVNGNRVYAFGHRFLDIGSTEMPFAHSDVVALIPNLNSSFKLSAPRQWMGTILSDRATAISGEIGRSAQTIPLSVTVHSSATGLHQYHFQVVNDRFLTPFITQTALFSVLDATERTLGRGTLQLTGSVDWGAGLPPLAIRDTFVSDSGLVQQVSLDAVVPLAFVLGAGFGNLHPKSISFQLEADESKRQLHLAQAWTSTHDVRPGEPFEITALLEGEDGVQFSRSISYRIPPGAPDGPLNLTVSDANTLNYPDFAGLSQSSL
ncbi:MAG: hypothetical protein M3Y72_13425, partial [Acidobacteriota bacterium]|nr:hypothetical protein [Acidobacteriota bacterium]